jgi:hypothetical protein
MVQGARPSVADHSRQTNLLGKWKMVRMISSTSRSVPVYPQLQTYRCAALSNAMYQTRKPDAGNRLIRLDERGWETGRWP